MERQVIVEEALPTITSGKACFLGGVPSKLFLVDALNNWLGLGWIPSVWLFAYGTSPPEGS